MDFTNINDPAGVQALLDQLRASQAWQELNHDPSPLLPNSAEHRDPPRTAEPSTSTPDVPSPLKKGGPVSESESPVFVSNHISSLLSRLRPDGNSVASPAPPRQSPFTPISKTQDQEANRSTSATLPVSPRAASPKAKSLRSFNFNQALPVIARLSENPSFMEKLEKIQEDQACLERTLWRERTQILKAQEEKLKVAQAKAAILGTGLSQSDASSLRSAFQEELRAFDYEQVLPAWDTLVAKQQATLEGLGVPGMFVTSLKADREKQQRIVQVLDGLVGTGDDDMEP